MKGNNDPPIWDLIHEFHRGPLTLPQAGSGGAGV